LNASLSVEVKKPLLAANGGAYASPWRESNRVEPL